MTFKYKPQFITLQKLFGVIFILFFSLYFPSQAHAAVTIVSTSNNTITSGNTITSNSPHITSGSNRLLLVGVSFKNNNDQVVNSVTYGGVAMSQVVQHSRDSDAYVEIWSLVESQSLPNSGNIIITFSSNIEDGAGFGAVSFSGVNQSQPFYSTATNDARSTNLNLTVPSKTGDLVFAIASQENENSPLAPDASLSEHWNFNVNNTSLGAGATKDGAASVSMTWSSGRDDWAMAGLSIQPPQPPTIITAHTACPSLKQVTVVFSDDINTATTGAGGGNPSNYSLNGITPNSAVVSGNKATLTMSSSLASPVTLIVNNVENTDGIALTTNSTLNFTNPDCTGLTGSCTTFKDTFSSTSYSNNDSDAGFNWLTSWSESGDGTTSPTAGNIQIVNNELFFDGDNTSSINRSLNINASTYDIAFLSFDYRTTDNWEDADTMTVSVSGNNIATLINDPNPNPVSQRIDISSNISSNTSLKFERATSRGSEDAYLDNVQVIACSSPPTMNSAAAACPNLNQVTVVYSKDVASTMLGADNYQNYTLSGGAGGPITAATVSGNAVTLTTTSALEKSTPYTVTANNITDLNSNPLTGLTVNFTTTNCTELVAHYRLDEEIWNGTTGEISSQTGLFNGSVVGSAIPMYPGQVCNTAYIPSNIIETDSYAVDTGINVNTDLGNNGTGSINFWFQSDTDWAGGGDRVLFDASDDTLGTATDKYFFLLVQNDGSLRFGLEDSNDGDWRFNTATYSFTANDWVHIGVTWDLPNDELKIYVNGVLAATDNSNTSGSFSSTNPFKSLYLGDNRSTYYPGGTQNSASGRIDEAYIYNIVIDANQMSADMNSTHTCTAIACSYRDDFTTSSFANNDGSIPWLSNWTETDTIAPYGPSTGYVSISNGSLVLQNNTPSESTTIPKITRDFSLTGVTSASIYYTFKLTGDVDPADEAIITMFDGTETVTIETITDLSNGTYSRNFSIPAAMLGENNIKLSMSINGAGHYASAGETISFLYLAIYPDNICSINTLHHLQMSHDGSGLTCEPENIKIKACADPGCVLSYSSDVTITAAPATSPTIWNPANPITIPANTEKTVQLSHKVLTPAGVPQTLALNITSSSPAPADSNVVCKDLSGTTLPNCNLIFYDSGFVFDLPAQLSCGTTAKTIGIRALRKDTETGSCISMFNSVKTIDFTVPSAPADDIVMNENALYTFNTSTNTRAVPLTFSNGAASFTLKRENNVGPFTLNASHTDAASGLALTGTTSIAYRPHEFFIEAKDNTNTTLLNSTDATGTAKWKASENFNLKLRAQCEGSAGSGTGSIATNYIPSLAEMWVELALPNPGNNSNFTMQGTDYLSLATAPASWSNISGKFYQGAITNVISPNPTDNTSYVDAAFHEVGVVKLHVRDSAYTGGGIPEQTLTIGRFTPHHFDTTLTAGCGSFTYSGQAFSLVATARNNLATATTTQNYNYNAVATLNFANQTTLSNANATVDDSANFSDNIIPANSFQNGSNQFTAQNVTYTFQTKETSPETIKLRANDPDSTTPGDLEAETEIRSGRLNLQNVFGPVTTPLNMQILAEYYSDDGFIINVDDSCSNYTATNSNLYNFTNNLDSGETSVNSTGTLASGLGLITFSAPGANNEGSVNLLLDNIDSWLSYEGGINCDADENTGYLVGPGKGYDSGACGTASFGLYRGDDRVIYWREVF